MALPVCLSTGQPTEYSTRMPGSSPSAGRLREVIQSRSLWVPPAASAVMSRLCRQAGGDLGDSPGENVDVVIGVVGAGGTRSQLFGQALPGVVTDDGHRVVAVAAAQPAGVFLAGDGVDEVRVDAQHDLLTEVTVGNQGRRDPAVPGDDEVPHPGADPGAGGVHPLQAGRVDLTQGAAQGRRGRDITEEIALVTQPVDGAYRVGAVSHHDRRIRQHPTPVMARSEVLPTQRVRQCPGQTGTVSDQPQGHRTRVDHDALAVGGDGQPPRPSGRILHARSAFRFGWFLT